MSFPVFKYFKFSRKEFLQMPWMRKIFFKPDMTTRVWPVRVLFVLFLFFNSIWFMGSLKGLPLFISLCLTGVPLVFAGYVIERQTRTAVIKTGLLESFKRDTEKKEQLKNNEITRTNNSLMLEILAHMEAEAELRKSEEKYRNLVAALPDGIFITQDRKIVFVNPGMERLTGCSADELVGKEADHLFFYQQPEDPGKETAAVEFCLGEGGRKIFIEKSFVEIIFAERPALLFSVRDITEKLAVGLEKKRLQKELQTAKKMEAFGILASGVAHDLNNVLSGLSSIPDLLLMDLPMDSPLVDQVRLIKDSGRKALSIVDELLTLVRGSAKIRGPVAFNSLIQDYFCSLEFMGLKKGFSQVEIITRLSPELPMIHASRVHMQKIIMNLISNAIEAVGKNKGTIMLETDRVSFIHQRIKGYEIIEKGEFIRFTVMDTGHGIPKDDMDHIFEPFYSKKKLGRSGTGMGLSIVWNAVHDHQGYIHVSSKKGRTFFTIYLPVQTKAEGTAQHASPPQMVTVEDYSGSNESILVVEDMEAQQKIAANILRRLGYRVSAASNSEQALAHAKTQKIDLVLMDMNLSSGCNGFETYRQLLLIDPKIKAIMTTGQDFPGEFEKAKALGAGDIIKKPVSLQTLGLAIKKELKNREQTI